MNETLQINPKFAQIIPPLTADEFAQLEENILKLGRVTDSIKIWNGTIVDGHHRYKIIQEHPDIPYTTEEMSFDSEYEAIAWMCSAQLGRRNITEANRQYLVGKRYDAEKNLWGGSRNSGEQSSRGEIRPLKKDHITRENIAKDTNTTKSYVKYADLFAKGIDIAESIDPGIKHDILSGNIAHSKMEIYELPKLKGDELEKAVRLLRVPKEKRKTEAQEIARQIEEAFANGVAQETEEEIPQEKEVIAPIPESAPTPKPAKTDENDSETEKHEIEESILNSMIGAVNMFIDSINNYLSRFPRLRTDPKYRSQTREIMVAARDYINDVEGDLL